ncbi:FtsX-like permease family protein [Cryptosporangium aurantiacum]|uniref:ABC-type transport system, involved in lipoprotein release, permease component n=1 Tax=Cryptosporangium aurantiacum TaxID=134849 RepID=A0A1M7RK56_9ACTN|nr:FtsX-like permease family protein [Cryptosporangium aurantiacum]SHN46520.1 ABC-type transport system, involved in lipoprotein release, permease component [Cryptosporangium aurantiacum]
MSWAAIVLVARLEWRRRRAALLALGLVIGLAGGLVVAGAVVTRRTTSAYPRLVEAVHRDDARVFAPVDHPGLSEAVPSLPEVRASWTARMWVGEVAATGLDLRYSTVTAPVERERPDLASPVVLRGRAPDPAAVDEVLLSEAFAGHAGLSVGSAFTLRMLTLDQFHRFATGFGAPAGPAMPVRVVGIMRMPSWGTLTSHVLSTPAFAARYAAAELGRITYVRLDRPVADRTAFRTGLDRLAAARPVVRREGAGHTDYEVVFPAESEDALVRPARRAAAAGLLLADAVAAAVVLLVVVQALARHHAGSARAQRIEAMLGLTTAERVTARLLPIVVTAVVATATALACGIAAGLVQPIGGLAGFDPRPGFRADPAAAGLGAAAVGLTVAVVAAGASALAGRSARGRRRPGRGPVPGGPAVLAGLRLGAAGTGRGTVGLTAAIAVAVAALTVGLSLDRLVSTPDRWGGSADLVVSDVLDEDLVRFRADPRVVGLAEALSGSVLIDGERVEAYAHRSWKGSVGPTVVDGRLPATVDEVCLGVRFAERHGLRVADTLTVTARDGTTRRLRVVGVGVGASLGDGSRLGGGVLLHPDTIGTVVLSEGYREGHLRVAPGALDDLVDDLGADREIYPRELPPEIGVLDGLRVVPSAVAAVMALAVVLVLLHALRGARRRSRRNLAVLGALGFTAAGQATVLAIVALRIALPAVLVGVPVGYGAGRIVWHEVATGSGVGGDAWLPVRIAVAGAVAVLGLAVVLAVAGRRTGRDRSARYLR